MTSIFLQVLQYTTPAITMLHLLLLVFVIAPALSISAHPSLESLTTCLTNHNVLNFSTPLSNASQFTSLLHFSIQNLRFQNGDGNLIRLPDALILPATPGEVQHAFNCCCSSELEERWLLRVRSGGHSYEGLSYTADAPFVVVDLMNVRSITIDLEAETAWVQSGATIGELYYTISQASPIHAFAAGTCSTVGMGGQISGGGNGWLARKYGVAADNVVDAEVIDAMGRLLDRRVMGEELFWALRGGGGGTWGIVLAWKVKLVSVPAIVTYFTLPTFTEKSKIIEVLGLWQEVAGSSAAPDELHNHLVISGVQNETVHVEFEGVYLGNVKTTLTLLTKMYPSLNFTSLNWKEMTWIEATSEGNGFDSPAEMLSRGHAKKRYFKSKSDFVRTPIPDNGLEGMLELFNRCPASGSIYLYPWGGEVGRKSSSLNAFPHRAGNLYKLEYSVSWEEDKNKVSWEAMAWLRELHAYMTPFVSSHPRAAYVNCIDLDLGDGFEAGHSYFLHNFPRLLHIKAQTDPDNIFNQPQGIPLLPNSSRLDITNRPSLTGKSKTQGLE